MREVAQKESILTHWTFLTTYEIVVSALLDDSQVTFLRIWAVVNFYLAKGINLLTSNTAQQ